eukprot:5521855-Pyramimonas_sp.AAC.1
MSAQGRAIMKRKRPRVRGRSRGAWLAPKPKSHPKNDRGRPEGAFVRAVVAGGVFVRSETTTFLRGLSERRASSSAAQKGSDARRSVSNENVRRPASSAHTPR